MKTAQVDELKKVLKGRNDNHHGKSKVDSNEQQEVEGKKSIPPPQAPFDPDAMVSFISNLLVRTVSF